MDPIVVNATPTADQWATTIRYFLVVVSTLATMFGYAHVAKDATGLLVIAGPLGGLAVFAMGLRKSRTQSQKLTVMAEALPDSIAVVKKP